MIFVIQGVVRGDYFKQPLFAVATEERAKEVCEKFNAFLKQLNEARIHFGPIEEFYKKELQITFNPEDWEAQSFGYRKIEIVFNDFQKDIIEKVSKSFKQTFHCTECGEECHHPVSLVSVQI